MDELVLYIISIDDIRKCVAPKKQITSQCILYSIHIQCHRTILNNVNKYINIRKKQRTECASFRPGKMEYEELREGAEL